MQSAFLNVDLEIESVAKLDLVAAEMGERVALLYLGPLGKSKRHLLAIEANRQFKSPDPVIHELCAVVASLSPKAKRIWDSADKVFDVGYELRADEKRSQFKLRAGTLERIAQLGASLTVTCYQREAPAKNSKPW